MDNGEKLTVYFIKGTGVKGKERRPTSKGYLIVFKELTEVLRKDLKRAYKVQGMICKVTWVWKRLQRLLKY